MKCHECGKDVGDDYYRFYEEMGEEVIVCDREHPPVCRIVWMMRQAVRKHKMTITIHDRVKIHDRIDALAARIAVLERHNWAPKAGEYHI